MSRDADPVQTVAPGSDAGLSSQVVTSLNPLAYGYWVVGVNGTVTEFGDAGGQGSSAVPAKTVLGGQHNVMSVPLRPSRSSL